MGDLHEIVDIGAVGKLFTVLAVVCPAFGLVIGSLVGRKIGRLRYGAICGLLWGSLGVLNWMLWRVYNALTDRNGLDSVKNLLINLTLFLFVGIAAGVIAARLNARVRYVDGTDQSGEQSAGPAQTP